MAKKALNTQTAGPGRHSAGDGLYLLVSPGRTKSWVLRVQSDGKRRDVGLGTFDDTPKKERSMQPIDIPILLRRHLTLMEAREKARILRDAAKAGLNPIVERDRERRSIPTFREAVKATYDALSGAWPEKGAKTFLSSMENHVYGTIGDHRVDTITAGDIITVLTPIWTTKPDMGRKVRQRIGTVLNFAHGKGWRPTEAPSKSISAGLPRQPQGGNYVAMPFAEAPAFVVKLAAETPTSGRQALLFQIFTAARPGEARGAKWGQIDLERREWNRPASLMKGRNAPPHTVTLNAAAVAVLDQMKGGRAPKPAELIFPGRGGAMLSDMTLNKVIRTAGLPYDAHGFRSSFRDWAAEMMPDTPDPVAEAALSHIVPDKVVRAYKRTSFIEMRRKLLDAWSAYLGTQPAAATPS